MRKTGSSTPIRLAALSLCAVLAAGSAQAASSQFSLQGQTDSGPLAGTSFSGSFAYDATAVQPGFSSSLVLNSFTLQFAGQTYSLATADAVPTAAFADGVFLGLEYNDVDSDNAALRPLLSLQPGFFGFEGEAQLAYVGAGGLAGFGSYSISAVPEPGSLALLLAGLGLVVGGVARRRPAADNPPRVASGPTPIASAHVRRLWLCATTLPSRRGTADAAA